MYILFLNFCQVRQFCLVSSTWKTFLNCILVAFSLFTMYLVHSRLSYLQFVYFRVKLYKVLYIPLLLVLFLCPQTDSHCSFQCLLSILTYYFSTIYYKLLLAYRVSSAQSRQYFISYMYIRVCCISLLLILLPPMFLCLFLCAQTVSGLLLVLASTWSSLLYP